MEEEKRWVLGIFFFLLSINLFFLTFNFTVKVKALKKILFYILSPAVKATEETVASAAQISSKFHRLVSAHQENIFLREEMKKALHWKNEYDRLISENKRLNDLLGLKQQSNYFSVAAKIISRDPSNWYQTVMIDKGSKDKLGLNQPVIAIQSGKIGVVGRISEVSFFSAKVLLLTDPLSGVAVDLQRSGVNGVLLGHNQDRLSLNFVTADSDVRDHDIVITSQIGEVFPPGLVLGEVEKTVVNKYQIFQNISVRPSLNFNNLHEVLVLVPEK